jgi:hypothetical protein
MAADPLRHDIVTDENVRSTAADYIRTMTEALPREVGIHSTLIALASTFVGICRDADIDPTAAFEQLADTFPHVGEGELANFMPTLLPN